MLPCIECGNPVVVEDGQAYVRCYSCGVRYYVMPNGLVPYYRLRAEVTLPDAALIARTSLEEELQLKGLQGTTILGQPKAYDFLFWSFLVPGQEMADTQMLVPAVPSALREIALMSLPARFLVSEMSSDSEDETVNPTMRSDDAFGRTGLPGPLQDDHISLVRVPLYEFPYTFEGRSFRIVVDAMTGTCMVDRFPRKAMVPPFTFVLLACLVAFGFEGWILWGHGAGLTVAYVVTALPVAAVTFLIARRRRMADSS